MFRPRNAEKEQKGPVKTTNMNRDANVPLVKTTDGKDFDPKSKRSSIAGSANGAEGDTEQAVQAQESKRRKRRILKIAVYCMFAVIAMGVFAIWILHKDSVESLRFGSTFLFTVKLRSLEVKDESGEAILYGDLGRHLLATPYDHCYYDNYESKEDNCLEWKKAARLHAEYFLPWENDTDRGACYTMRWVGYNPKFSAEDCFYLQGFTWYGALTNHNAAWPVSGVRLSDGTEYYANYPSEQIGNRVPAWFGSQGIAILVDSSFPFTVSWNVTDKRQFCIASKLHMLDEEDSVPKELLRYTICQGRNIREVYHSSHCFQESLANFDKSNKAKGSVGLCGRAQSTEDNSAVIPSIMPNPIRTLNSLEDAPRLLSALNSLKDTNCSQMEIFSSWEENPGDLSLRQDAQPILSELIQAAKQHGCSPVLPVSTFFSFRSSHFQEGVAKKYFLRDSQGLATHMLLWRDQEGAVLDITNPEAVKWFMNHIGNLMNNLGICAIKLLHIVVPPDASYQDVNVTNLDYTHILFNKIDASLNRMNLTNNCYSNSSLAMPPRLVLEKVTGFITTPVYTSLRLTWHSNCLDTSIIAEAFTMGLSSYPLLIADSEVAKMQSDKPESKSLPDASIEKDMGAKVDESKATPTDDNYISQGLMVRWLQLAAFFPGLRFSSVTNDQVLVEHLKKIMELRRAELLPYMMETWRDQPRLPLIRPLIWNWPDDEEVIGLVDQFMVGDRLLVAPVLCEGQTRRKVYLPAGSWQRSRDDPRVLKGPKVYTVDVSNDSILPYFWKLTGDEDT